MKLINALIDCLKIIFSNLLIKKFEDEWDLQFINLEKKDNVRDISRKKNLCKSKTTLSHL